MEEEQKVGNDIAETAAEKGAVTIQKVTQQLADIYSWRHGGYRRLMIIIQKYIVGLRNHARELREKAKKEEDPFGSSKDEKVGIPRRLGYADPVEETKYLNTTALHRLWFDTDARHAEATKIHSFLGWVKWRAEDKEEGGATWLELYLL